MHSREKNYDILREHMTNEQLEKLLASGKYDPNTNIQGRNALHVMLKIPSAWKVQRTTFLLEQGVDINSKGAGYENTPIQAFIANEETEIVIHMINEALRLKIFIDYNLRDREKKTSLILATKTMNEKLSLFILDHAIKQKTFDINAVDADGMTALHYACALGMLAVVRALIVNGADLTKENAKKKTPIDCTAMDQQSVIAILKSVSIAPDRDENAVRNDVHDKNSQDIVIINANDVSPITNFPSIKSSREMLELLIKDARMLDSTYTFEMASSNINAQNLLELLLKNCLSESEKNKLLLQFDRMTGRSCLQKALAGQHDVRSLLIEKGCDYSWLLRQFASNGSSELFALLNLPSTKQYINKAGEPSLKTALHQAAAGGFINSCAQLIKAGAEVNCVEKDGNTPIMLAYIKRKYDAVLFLAKLGSDLSVKNKSNKNIFALIADDKNYAFNNRLIAAIHSKEIPIKDIKMESVMPRP